jgi:hypothetical protein
MDYIVELYLERIDARITWHVSEKHVDRLRRDVIVGELGPARILNIEAAYSEEQAA